MSVVYLMENYSKFIDKKDIENMLYEYITGNVQKEIQMTIQGIYIPRHIEIDQYYDKSLMMNCKVKIAKQLKNFKISVGNTTGESARVVFDVFFRIPVGIIETSDMRHDDNRNYLSDVDIVDMTTTSKMVLRKEFLPYIVSYKIDRVV